LSRRELTRHACQHFDPIDNFDEVLNVPKRNPFLDMECDEISRSVIVPILESIHGYILQNQVPRSNTTNQTSLNWATDMQTEWVFLPLQIPRKGNDIAPYFEKLKSMDERGRCLNTYFSHHLLKTCPKCLGPVQIVLQKDTNPGNTRLVPKIRPICSTAMFVHMEPKSTSQCDDANLHMKASCEEYLLCYNRGYPLHFHVIVRWKIRTFGGTSIRSNFLAVGKQPTGGSWTV
jgi:hypothetical protein